MVGGRVPWLVARREEGGGRLVTAWRQRSKRRLPVPQRLRALTSVASGAGAPRMSNRFMEGPKVPSSSPREGTDGAGDAGLPCTWGLCGHMKPLQVLPGLSPSCGRNFSMCGDGTWVLGRGGAHTYRGFTTPPSSFLSGSYTCREPQGL